MAGTGLLPCVVPPQLPHGRPMPEAPDLPVPAGARPARADALPLLGVTQLDMLLSPQPLGQAVREAKG